MYIALDHSPLHFAQFEYKNIYTTTMRLGYNIGMHYVSDAIFGAGWVVGSLEILGRLFSKFFAYCFFLLFFAFKKGHSFHSSIPISVQVVWHALYRPVYGILFRCQYKD